MANFGKLNFAVAFNPQTAFPLDARYYFDSLEAAQTAAAGAVEVGSSTGTYFYGENIVVVADGNATLYIIQPPVNGGAPTLKEVGAKTLGDGKSIQLSDEGVLSLVGVADAAVNTVPSKQSDGSIEWVNVADIAPQVVTTTVSAGKGVTVNDSGTDGSHAYKVVADIDTEQGLKFSDGADEAKIQVNVKSDDLFLEINANGEIATKGIQDAIDTGVNKFKAGNGISLADDKTIAVKAVVGTEDAPNYVEVTSDGIQSTSALQTELNNIKNSISGAMHFVGVSTTDPQESTGATVSGVSDYHKGDVVLYKGADGSFDKEFVYLGTSGNSNTNWYELGDVTEETGRLNALDTEISTINSSIGTINGSIGTINDSINTINTNISTINTTIDNLDLAEVTVGASKTLTSIKQENGKVTASTVDILIEQSQVNNLSSSLDNKQAKITTDAKLSADLVADGTTNKVFTATEKTKLAGLENYDDTALAGRVTTLENAGHITQADVKVDDVTIEKGAEDKLAVKAIAIAKVTGLQDALNGLQDSFSTVEQGLINESAARVEAISGINTTLNGKVNKEEGKGLSTNDFTNADKSAVTANTTARHSHDNKTLLDSYDQTNADLTDAVSKKHSHTNKTVLDNTTASFTTDLASILQDIDEITIPAIQEELGTIQEELDTKVDKVEGKGLSTNDYTTDDKSAVAANTTARHTHDNKTLLDTYDQTNADLSDAVSKKHSHSNKTVLDATQESFTTELKNKLDGIEEGANNYTLPEATSTRLGGVKVDESLSSTSTNPLQNKVITSALSSKMEWDDLSDAPVEDDNSPISSAGVYATLASLFPHSVEVSNFTPVYGLTNTTLSTTVKTYNSNVQLNLVEPDNITNTMTESYVDNTNSSFKVREYTHTWQYNNFISNLILNANRDSTAVKVKAEVLSGTDILAETLIQTPLNYPYKVVTDSSEWFEGDLYNIVDDYTIQSDSNITWPWLINTTIINPTIDTNTGEYIHIIADARLPITIKSNGFIVAAKVMPFGEYEGMGNDYVYPNGHKMKYNGLTIYEIGPLVPGQHTFEIIPHQGAYLNNTNNN